MNRPSSDGGLPTKFRQAIKVQLNEPHPKRRDETRKLTLWKEGCQWEMRRNERGYWWINMTKAPYINMWDFQAVKNREKRFNNLFLIVPLQSGFIFAWASVDPLFTFLHSSIQWLLTTSSTKKNSLIGLYLHVSQKLTEWAHMHYIFCLFPGIITLLAFFLTFNTSLFLVA